MPPLEQTETEKLYSHIQALKKTLASEGNDQKLQDQILVLENKYASRRLHEVILEPEPYVL
jgi:hypothetical protein